MLSDLPDVFGVSIIGDNEIDAAVFKRHEYIWEKQQIGFERLAQRLRKRPECPYPPQVAA